MELSIPEASILRGCGLGGAAGGELTFDGLAVGHDVEYTEDTGGHKDDGLETPADNRIGGTVAVAYTEEAEGKHDGDVPWSETTVGGDGHAARTEHENHKSRDKSERIGGVRHQLTGEGEGKEADVCLEEIADPDTESEDEIQTCPLHVEKHFEAVPDAEDTCIDTFDEFGVAEI